MKDPATILAEAKREAPFTEKQKPNIGQALEQRPPRDATKWKIEHPLGRALRNAKIEIAKILSDKANLEYLAMALQTRFSEDPVGFLLKFEPLLAKFEVPAEQTKRQGVRILVDGKAAIEAT